MLGRCGTFLAVLAVAAVCFAPSRLRATLVDDYYAAPTIGFYSVEYSVATADRIYVVKLTDVSTTPPPTSTTVPPTVDVFGVPPAGLFGSRVFGPGGARQWITATIVETIKGPAAPSVGPLSVPHDTFPVGPVRPLSSSATEDRYLLLLDGAAGRLVGLSVDMPWALTMDGRALTTGTQLIAAMRSVRPQTATKYGVIPLYVSAATFNGMNQPVILMPVATTASATELTPAERIVRPDSEHWGFLRVPIDSKLETLAHAWIRSIDRRRQLSGVWALGYFPSPKNAALLRPFLRDADARPDAMALGDSLADGSETPGEVGPEVLDGVSPWTGARYYPFRVAAAGALHHMGLPTNAVTVTEGPFLYHRWGWWFALALAVPFAVVWWLLRRVGFLRPWGTRLAAMALLTAAALAGVLATSFRWDHLLGVTASSTYHDVAIHHGQVRYETLADFPYPCPLSYACLPAGEFPQLVSEGPFGMAISPAEPGRNGYIPWHQFTSEPIVGVADQAYMVGLSHAPFYPSHDFDSPYCFPLAGPWSARVYIVPLWPAPVVLALPALALCLRAGWRGMRRRRRMKRGLCLICGYDLRAHAAGQRCPECGTVIAARGNPAGVGS